MLFNNLWFGILYSNGWMLVINPAMAEEAKARFALIWKLKKSKA